MRIVTRFGFSMLMVVALISCDYLSNRESVSPIIDTELPSTSAVGENVSFKIYHIVYNGCGQYSRQETTMEGNTVTVKFYGKYPNNRICPDNIPTLETSYNFEPKAKGYYYFKFFQDNYGGQEFILDTLSVQ